MSTLKPLNGFLILKPVETSEEMVGGIIVPDMGKERPESGEVIATSSVYNYNTDRYVDSQLTVGQIVLIPKMGTQKITLEGQDYFITKESEILAILN